MFKIGCSNQGGNQLVFSEKFISLEIIPIFSMSELKIKLQLKKDVKEGALGIAEIGSVLKDLQDTICNIAEYNIAEITSDNKKSFRITGKRPSLIEKRAKLTLNTCGIGSFDAEIVGESQVAIEGKSVVDEAVDFFGEITYNLNTSSDLENEIKNLIPDSRHRSRIISDIGAFWPGIENKYELYLETNQFKRVSLKKERRRIIQHISKREHKLQKETIMGVLAGGHLIRDREFKLEMPDGKEIKCKFRKELDKIVDNLLRKPIIVEGIFRTTAGELKDIAEVISINLFKDISINRIITDTGELKLKQDIKIDITFNKDEGVWIFNYPDLNIISCGKTYDKTMEEFQRDFFELHEHYGLGDQNKMHDNAIKIKNIFKDIVK